MLQIELYSNYQSVRSVVHQIFLVKTTFDFSLIIFNNFKATMIKGRLMILIFALLSKALVSATPLNTCPAFLSPYFIFYQEGATIAHIPTTINFPNALFTTITLQNAQPDISFRTAVNYMYLTMPAVQSAIQIDLWVDSFTTTTIDVAIIAPSSGQSMQILKIVYLIVPSAFNNDVYIFTPNSCLYASCGFDYTLNPGASINFLQSYPVSLTSGTYQIVGFFNGLNIKSTNHPNGIIGLTLDVSYISIIRYNINITSISSITVLLQSYNVTVILFRSPSTLYGVKITTLTLSGTNFINDSSISPGKTFFGVSQYSFQNANFQFIIDVANKTATKTLVADMISFKVSLISFEVGSCCLSTPFIDAANSSCVATCSDRYYPGVYSDNISNSCQPCSYDCFTCNSSSSCTSCNITTDFRQFNSLTLSCDPIDGYYDAGITIALPCNYPQCCGQAPIVYFEAASCVVTCPSGFVANATNVCVPCGTGYWAVSGYCTNLVGCVANIVVNGSLQCIFCRFSDHFFLQNQTCVCMEGYSLDTVTGKCIEVCGDGIHFSQKCDDNNTEDGDGCSSTCQSEDYFLCNSTSNYFPSQCAYVSNVQLTFNSAKKTEGKNQGVFSFGLSAKHAILNVAKIISNFTFTCDSRVTAVTMSASSTEFLLIVDYEEDLQGKIASVTLNLNPKKVLQSTSILPMILMVSSNEQLIVVRSYLMLAILKKIIQILDLVALVVFVVASFAYRMIAVELLHSFLLVYLFCLETSNPTEPFLVFKNFRKLALNFDDLGNHYSQGGALSYSFQSQMTTKQTLAFLLIAELVVVALQKIIKEYIKDSTSKLTDRQIKIMAIVRYACISGLFSLSIGYGYQIIMPGLIFYNNEWNYQQNYQYQAAALVLFLAICFNVLFFGEFWQTLLKPKDDEEYAKSLHKRCYPSYYLLFWMILMILLVTNIVIKGHCMEESSLAVALPFFLWFICNRPYNKSIHNVGQIINLTIGVVFLSWGVGRKYSAFLKEEDTEIYLSFAIVFLMAVSIVLSVFRLISVIRSGCQHSQKAVTTVKTEGQAKIYCERIEDVLQIENKYRIMSILLSEQLLEINGSMHPVRNFKRKRQMTATLKQKYKIQNSEQVDDVDK